MSFFSWCKEKVARGCQKIKNGYHFISEKKKSAERWWEHKSNRAHVTAADFLKTLPEVLSIYGIVSYNLWVFSADCAETSDDTSVGFQPTTIWALEGSAMLTMLMMRLFFVHQRCKAARQVFLDADESSTAEVVADTSCFRSRRIEAAGLWWERKSNQAYVNITDIVGIVREVSFGYGIVKSSIWLFLAGCAKKPEDTPVELSDNRVMALEATGMGAIFMLRLILVWLRYKSIRKEASERKQDQSNSNDSDVTSDSWGEVLDQYQEQYSDEQEADENKSIMSGASSVSSYHSVDDKDPLSHSASIPPKAKGCCGDCCGGRTLLDCVDGLVSALPVGWVAACAALLFVDLNDALTAGPKSRVGCQQIPAFQLGCMIVAGLVAAGTAPNRTSAFIQRVRENPHLYQEEDASISPGQGENKGVIAQFSEKRSWWYWFDELLCRGGVGLVAFYSSILIIHLDRRITEGGGRLVKLGCHQLSGLQITGAAFISLMAVLGASNGVTQRIKRWKENPESFWKDNNDYKRSRVGIFRSPLVEPSFVDSDNHDSQPFLDISVHEDDQDQDEKALLK